MNVISILLFLLNANLTPNPALPGVYGRTHSGHSGPRSSSRGWTETRAPRCKCRRRHRPVCPPRTGGCSSPWRIFPSHSPACYLCRVRWETATGWTVLVYRSRKRLDVLCTTCVQNDNSTFGKQQRERDMQNFMARYCFSDIHRHGVVAFSWRTLWGRESLAFESHVKVKWTVKQLECWLGWLGVFASPGPSLQKDPVNTNKQALPWRWALSSTASATPSPSISIISGPKCTLNTATGLDFSVLFRIVSVL